MTVTSSHRLQGGFTLLELLVVIVLLGFLTTMLLAAFRLGTRHVDRQNVRIERAARIPAVESFLRAQLADAQPILDPLSPQKNILFEGRPDGLDFIGLAPESLAQGGLLLFTLERNRRSADQLRLRWRLFGVPEFVPERDIHDTILLDGVAGLAFRYYGVIPPDTLPAWHEAWVAMDYLPSLIRLDVGFRDGTRMPELTVATRISLSPRAQ